MDNLIIITLGSENEKFNFDKEYLSEKFGERIMYLDYLNDKHPNEHINFARYIAEQINKKDLKFLVFCLSPIFLMEINNLIMLNSNKLTKKVRSFGYKKSHKLNSDTVKCYNIEDGKYVLCNKKDDGIYLKYFNESIDGMNGRNNHLYYNCMK